jgi:Flp pilus assembly protein CpaB
MRASTFFALFIAVLLGFAALAAARYFHLFQTTPTQQKEVAAKKELPKVLVAKKNLYEGIAMSANDVQVRELRADELADYEKNPADYLPPTTEAAVLRVMNTNLQAGQILLNKHVEPIFIPPGLPGRISPKMAAVNVAVPKEHAAGGLIRNDDYVDVYLTTAIAGDKSAPVIYKTAPIAQNLCVIVKRDMLWPVLAAVPENKPLQFTLEANPYRAALIDYAKTKGQLTLVPTSKAPRAKNAKLAPPATFTIPGSKEYLNEDQRVAAIIQGDRSVGDGDLERIFGLPPLPIRETIQIETLSGTKKTKEGPFQFVRLTNPADRRMVDPDQPNYGYRFSAPPSASAEPAQATAQASPFARPVTKPR